MARVRSCRCAAAFLPFVARCGTSISAVTLMRDSDPELAALAVACGGAGGGGYPPPPPPPPVVVPGGAAAGCVDNPAWRLNGAHRLDPGTMPGTPSPPSHVPPSKWRPAFAAWIPQADWSVAWTSPPRSGPRTASRPTRSASARSPAAATAPSRTWCSRSGRCRPCSRSPTRPASSGSHSRPSGCAPHRRRTCPPSFEVMSREERMGLAHARSSF